MKKKVDNSVEGSGDKLGRTFVRAGYTAGDWSDGYQVGE